MHWVPLLFSPSISVVVTVTIIIIIIRIIIIVIVTVIITQSLLRGPHFKSITLQCRICFSASCLYSSCKNPVKYLNLPLSKDNITQTWLSGMHFYMVFLNWCIFAAFVSLKMSSKWSKLHPEAIFAKVGVLLVVPLYSSSWAPAF